MSMFERMQPKTDTVQPTAPTEEGPTLKQIAAVLLMVSLFLIITFNAIHVGFVWTDTHFKGVEEADYRARTNSINDQWKADAEERCRTKVLTKAKGFEKVTLDMCKRAV